ncbi:MAG: hydroxyacylglutathione hydrolase [Gammaproteobacteria bacterium]|nr:MAG: hydroxyacylglutathione hydrolase [Gammaproteobacteria bacterium]
MISVKPVSAFSDNYIWMLCNQEVSACIAVDPGDATPVQQFIAANKFDLIAILVTHHHLDHTGGVQTLADHYHAPVYGAKNSKFNGITNQLEDNDRFSIMGANFTCLTVPGHTLDHIALFVDQTETDSLIAEPLVSKPLLFCGDTLFSGGCGRLFEGDAETMLNSLNKLKVLPHQTRVYCGHEYTLGNLAFAQTIEPGNRALADYTALCEQKRQKGLPTLPSDMATELSINPFLRTDQASVIDAAKALEPMTDTSEQRIFAALRKAKDYF